MTDIAREAGVSRENLYRALSGDTKPEFATILSVLRAFGVDLSVRPSRKKSAATGTAARKRVARTPAPPKVRRQSDAAGKRAKRSRAQ